MLVPTALLTVAALVVAFFPGLDHAIQEAAARFTDSGAYARAVLHGHARFASIEPKGIKAIDYLWATLTLVVAFGIAGISLFGGRLERPGLAPLRRAADRAQGALGSLHSGHVGDYVAWMTAAMGAFAIAVALATR
jgi:multicomponent Na+:H+ antiporter subunit D